jgi:hypothetical protein
LRTEGKGLKSGQSTNVSIFSKRTPGDSDSFNYIQVFFLGLEVYGLGGDFLSCKGENVVRDALLLLQWV